MATVKHLSNSLAAASCSDEVEVPPEIRPPEQLVDDSAYCPPAQLARAARIEPSTFRYARMKTCRVA